MCILSMLWRLGIIYMVVRFIFNIPLHGIGRDCFFFACAPLGPFLFFYFLLQVDVMFYHNLCYALCASFNAVISIAKL